MLEHVDFSGPAEGPGILRLQFPGQMF
jgi:hypothetical protein